MIALVSLCANTPEETFANCFSPASSLEGDSQQMTLTLILQPNPEANANCFNENNTIATAVVTFAIPIGALGEEFNATFRYYSGQTNRAVIDLEQSGFDITSFMEMTQVENAMYEVSIQQLNTIKGTVNQISHIKQDVSSCWNNINFIFGIMPGDEYIGFEFKPNMCQIPEDVLDSIVMLMRVEDMTPEKNTIFDLPIMESNETNGFKLPYAHEDTLLTKQYCADYEDVDMTRSCLDFIQLTIKDTEWSSYVVLQYTYMEIDTEIIGTIDTYELFESNLCSTASNLAVVTYITRTLISHDRFSQISECNQQMEATAHVVGIFELVADDGLIIFNVNYTNDEFYNNRNFALDNDNSLVFGETTYMYGQYIFYDESDKIIGGYSLFLYDERSCESFVVMKIAKETISLEQWMESNEFCKGKVEYDWEVDLMDQTQTAFLSFPPQNELLDREIAVNIMTLSCKDTTDPADCQEQLKMARSLSLKDQVSFEMQSTLRYIGSEVYMDDITLGLVFPFVLMCVYLIAGAITVVVVLRHKHKEDDF